MLVIYRILYIDSASNLTTPTMHQVVRAVEVHFCDLHEDIYFGREDVVEAAQVLTRQLLARVVATGTKMKNTEMIVM